MISRRWPWNNTLLDNMSALEATRRGGLVRRYHTHPYIIGEQSVAAHTFNMACIYIVLHPVPESLNTLAAILMHDVAEAAVGDTPSPAKWANDDLRKALDDSERNVRARFELDYEGLLDDTEMNWIKFCDYFEGAMFARDQITMGNVGCQIVFELFMSTLHKLKESWEGWPSCLEDECRQLIIQYEKLTGESVQWNWTKVKA